MPERVYMTVDPRRDHSFPIPDPGRSLDSATPNACNNCHGDKTPAWAAESMRGWGVTVATSRWKALNRGLALQDALVFHDYARNPPTSLPALRAASLLAKMSAFPSRLAFERASAQLSSPDPLLRRAAVGVLQSTPPEARWQLLSPLIEDPLQSVRHEVAIALADMSAQLAGSDAERLEVLINDLRESLEYHADSPAGQMAIGNLELRSGFPILAEQAFKKALEIEPSFVPALINLADLYRVFGSEGEARALLQRALEVAPDNANTNHAYGLHLVRAGQQEDALNYLEAATRQQDTNPRHVYVYAVALDSREQTDEAIQLIEQASRRWVNNIELYFLQVSYMDKTGNTAGIHRYLSTLVSIASNNPQVRNWMAKYGNKP
jgi:tetratricopeptide (TPR) repeat protein